MSNSKDGVQVFSTRLNEALKIRKVSAAELSRRTGIDQAAISRYKKGEYAPKSKSVFDIARVLGVDPAWLLGFSDDMLHKTSSSDGARNELESLISDMDIEQIKKTITFIREYIF